MGIFIQQRERLLRTDWPNATMLAQELYTMFGSQDPIQIDSPLEISAQPDQSPITINYGAKPPDPPWVTVPWVKDGNATDQPTSGGVTINVGGVTFDPIAGQWVTPPGTGDTVINVPGYQPGAWVVPPWGVQPDADPFQQPPPIAVNNGPPQVWTNPQVFANTTYVYNPTSTEFTWDGKTWPFDFPPPTSGELVPVNWITDPTKAIPDPFPVQDYKPPDDARQGSPDTIDKSKLPPPIGKGDPGSGAIPAIYHVGNVWTLYATGYQHAATGQTSDVVVLNLAVGELLPEGLEALLTKVLTDPVNGLYTYYANIPVWLS